MSENDASVIAENKVKSPVSGDVVEVKSLWEEQTCVITFFRRFGCGFCRLAAKQLSSIKPQLDANNVRLIGIGVEALGVEEFMNGKFFDGDLFIDEEKKCYQDLKYKRFGIFGMGPAMLAKSSRDAIAKVRSEKLGSNMKGDVFQVGGTLVVAKGGEKVLFSHKQESLADHADPCEILKALNIAEEQKTETEPETEAAAN